MNNEQHYTVTQLNYDTVNIRPDEGYYFTKEDLKIVMSTPEQDWFMPFTITRKKDLSYDVNVFGFNVSSATININIHELHEETEMPEIVKQKIMTEEYTIEVTCDIVDLQMHIDGKNYLQSCSLDVDRFIKDQGVIGGFVANEFDLKLMGFPNIDITGQQLNVNATINYSIEGTDYTYDIVVGTYTISTCTYDDTSGTHTIKAYDNALLYNIDYEPHVEFPCTVIELLNDVLNQTKQKLENSVERYVCVLPKGTPMANYYFTVDGVNYALDMGGGGEDPEPLPFDASMMFDGTDILIRGYYKMEGQTEEKVIYQYTTSTVLDDTTGYTYLDFKKVQYIPFDNNLFVVHSNQFDVSTQTNQNDQSVEITHASCRSVVQDIAKTAFGWAYINANGELALGKLKPALSSLWNNTYIPGRTIQHKPANPNEIISPVNPAEVEYLSWAQTSVTYNSGYFAYSDDTLVLDGLTADAYGSLIVLHSGTSTNTEPSLNKWDVDYLLPEQMFVRFGVNIVTPHLKYIHNGETIVTDELVTILEKGDRIIEIGYTIQPNTVIDEQFGYLNVLFSTMDHFNDEYVNWVGEYAAYGLLNYIDENHYDELTYVLDRTNPYFGYVVVTWGASFVVGAQLTWSYDSENELFYAPLPTSIDFPGGAQVPVYAEDGTSLICKYYQGNTPGSDDDYFMYLSDNTVYVKNKDFTSIEEWNAWLYTVAQDFIINYGLATPLEVPAYQYPSILIETLDAYKYYNYKVIIFSSLGSEYLNMYRKLNNDQTYGTIDTNHYITSKQNSEATKPINKILVGLKDIEGENVYITSPDYVEDKTEDSIIAIYDNNITYTPELRTEVLKEGANELFDMYYVPLSIDMPGMPWLLNCTPYFFKNIDGDTLVSYAFKSHFDYQGYITQKISSESTTSVQSEYSYDSSYTSALNQTRYIVDKQNQQITSLIQSVNENTSELSRIQQDVRSWTAEFESVGGGNYVKNSVGLGDATNLVWEFTADSQTSTYEYGSSADASLYTKSGSRWYLNGYKMKQTINVLQNSQYAFACKIKKPIDTNENCYIKIYDTSNPTNYKEIIPDPAKAYNYDEVILSGENAITPQTTNITIEVYASEGCQLTISDIMLNAGTMCSVWTPAAGEILTTNVKMDAGGLRVLSTDYINNGLGDYTMVTPSYFRGYGNNNGTEECVFQVSGTETNTHDLQVRNSQTYGNAGSSHYNTKVIPITNANYDGIAFIKTQGN